MTDDDLIPRFPERPRRTGAGVRRVSPSSTVPTFVPRAPRGSDVAATDGAGVEGADAVTAPPTARSWLVMVVAAMLSALFSAALTVVAWIVLPGAFGFGSVSITSGSMSPGIEPGDVVVYERHVDNFRVGDVVVVREPAGDDLVTHRIADRKDGAFVTKGDANAIPDSTPVGRRRILGRARFIVPGVARWSRLAPFAFAVAAVALCVFAVAGRRRRSSARGEGPTRRDGRGRRLRAALSVFATSTVAIVTVMSVGFAAFISSTTNGLNFFSTEFDPPSVPAAVDAQLAANGPIYATAFDGSTLYVGGDFTRIDGTVRNRLAAFDLTTGTMTAWNPGADNAVNTLVVDSTGGRVFVGGAFATLGGATRNRIGAVPTTSDSATVFDPDANNVVRAMGYDAVDGLLYLGGDFTTVGGTARLRGAAVSAATGAVNAWDPQLNAAVYSIVVDHAEGNVFVGGAFTTVGGASQGYVTEIGIASGSRTAWDPNVSATVRALTLDASGRLLYLGGDFVSAGAAARNRLAAVSIDDGLANAWDPSVTGGAPTGVYALVHDPVRGIAYAGGGFAQLAGTYRSRFAAISELTGNSLRFDVPLDGQVAALAIDPGTGRIAIGGAFTAAGGLDRSSLVVVAPANNPDSDEPFPSSIDIGTTGTINASVRVGNVLYVGGDFTYLNGLPRRRLGAIDLTTSTVTAWDPAADGTVFALAADTTTGTIFAGGDFLSIDGAFRQRLGAIDASGAVTGWAPGADSTVNALVVAPTVDAVFAGGTFARAGSENRSRLARVSIATGLATTWIATVTGTSVNGLALDLGNDRLYAAGQFTAVGGTTRNNLARVSAASGALDAAFDPNVNSTMRAIALNAAATTLYLGGDFTILNGATTRNRLAAVATASGTATAWNPNVNASVFSLAMDAGGTAIFAGGQFTTVGGSARVRAAAVDTTSGSATAWNPNVSTAGSTVRSIALDSATGRAWLAGNFATVGGFARGSLAQVSGGPAGVAVVDALSVTAPNATGIVYSSARVGSTLYFGGTFTYVGGVLRNRLAAIDLGADSVAAWNPNLNGAVNAVAVDTTRNVLYAGGGFTAINGATTRNRIAAVDLTTGTATAWNPNSGNAINAVAVDSATGVVYTGGTFTTIGGATRNRIAALDPTTATATVWNPNASSTVWSIALSGGLVYAGGGFTTIGGATRNRIAALSPATALATAFDPNANSTVYVITADAANSTVLLGGAFTQVSGQTRNKLASVSNAGALTLWNPNLNSSAGTDVFAMQLTADSIVAAGAFTTVAGGLPRGRVAAFERSTGALVDWSPDVSGTIRTVTFGAADIAVMGSFTASDLIAVGSWTRFSGVPSLQSAAHILTPKLFTGAAAVSVFATLIVGDIAYLGGDFAAAGGMAHKRIAAVDLVTGSVLAWAPGTDQPVRAFAHDTTTSTLYAGGDFVVVNGSVSRARLAAFSTVDGAVRPLNVAVSGVVRALALNSPGDTLYLGGDFTGAASVGAATRNRVAAISTTTGAVGAFDVNASATVRALLLDDADTTMYVAGDFVTVNGATTRNRVAAASVATGVATSFNPNANGLVYALASDAGRSVLYLAGAFTTVNGATVRNRLAAVALGTSTATAWDPNVNAAIYAMAFEPASDRVYFGGAFTAVGVVSRSRLASIAAATGALASWNPGANGAVNVVVLSPLSHRAAVGGVFTTTGGIARTAFAVF